MSNPQIGTRFISWRGFTWRFFPPRAIIFSDQPCGHLHPRDYTLAVGASGARGTTSITPSFLLLSKQLITRPLFGAALIPLRFVARARDNALSRSKGASQRRVYKYVSIVSRWSSLFTRSITLYSAFFALVETTRLPMQVSIMFRYSLIIYRVFEAWIRNDSQFLTRRRRHLVQVHAVCVHLATADI